MENAEIKNEVLFDEFLEKIRKRDFDSVKKMLDDGVVNPSLHDSCALVWAAEYGTLDIFKLLLDDGRANPADNKSYIFYHAVSLFSQPEILKLLIKDGRSNPKEALDSAPEWDATVQTIKIVSDALHQKNFKNIN